MKLWKFIKFLIFDSNQKIVLGRWKVIHDQKVIHSRIDWSNLDNCGCSGIKNK